MTAGRWPKGAEKTLALSMDNAARAMTEKELGEKAVRQVRTLFAQVKLGLGMYPADMQVCIVRGFRELMATVCRQYELDCEDLEEAPQICGGVESLIQRREPPVSRAALTHTVRV